MQSAVNGALVTYAAPYLQEGDPTGGGIFFSVLSATQVGWQERIEHVSTHLRSFMRLNLLASQ